MVAMMSSAMMFLPMLRKAPASLPAIVLCPPFRSWGRISEALDIVERAALVSMGFFEKKPGEHAISAAGNVRI